MKVPRFISGNLLLKITSLNSAVISVRLLISLVVQRLLADIVGESGISKIGQLRNLSQILTSISSLGIFNGIVKYIAEQREDEIQLLKLFSTAFVFVTIGSVVFGTALFFGAEYISLQLFTSATYAYIIKIVAILVPAIAVYRIFNGVVNGLSLYKKYAKIDLFSYLLSTGLLIYLLFQYEIEGALIAIAITPLIQLIILMVLFFRTLKAYIRFKNISFRIPMARSLLAFSLMSFFSTVLLNYIEIDIRTMIIKRITETDAGIWTAMTNISKNYMVFSTGIFSLYVLPKFASIHTEKGFRSELSKIYKTLLPFFGIGMILVFVFRDLIIQLIYPGFLEMEPLFKWQLLGDFIRLASLILMYQFLAKKLVRSFIFSEVISLGLFYVFARLLIDNWGIEGVVIAHFIRYIIYFFVVLYLVLRFFKRQRKKISP